MFLNLNAVFVKIMRKWGVLLHEQLSFFIFFCAFPPRPKQENGRGVPVDALLFFETRARMKDQDSAILVSSQGGVLEFWSMFGPLRPRGTGVICLEAIYSQNEMPLAFLDHSTICPSLVHKIRLLSSIK